MWKSIYELYLSARFIVRINKLWFGLFFIFNAIDYRLFVIENEVISIYSSFRGTHKRIPLCYNLWGKTACYKPFLNCLIWYIFPLIEKSWNFRIKCVSVGNSFITYASSMIFFFLVYLCDSIFLNIFFPNFLLSYVCIIHEVLLCFVSHYQKQFSQCT